MFFKAEWVLAAQHIIVTCDSFNQAQILSINLQEKIDKYHKTRESKKPQFYMLAYVMDVFCATSSFRDLGWNWKKDCPPVHIYCSDV